MAASIKTDNGLEIEPATSLFQTRLPLRPLSLDNRHEYDVTADGQRFIVTVPLTEARPPITVVLNWPALLKK